MGVEYRVRWSIDIEAESPEEAARKALAIHRNPESIATVFHVRERGPLERAGTSPADGRRYRSKKIDLTAIDEPWRV